MNKREEERLRKQQEKVAKMSWKDWRQCGFMKKNTLPASISAELMRWAEDRLPVLLWQGQLCFRQMYKFYI